MKNRSPQAICTRRRKMTITTPPSWPSKFTSTKTVAKNFPQFHDIFMYSLCSFHLKAKIEIMITGWDSLSVFCTYCTHIRIPSSKKVAIRQRRATVGRIRFPLRCTCETEKWQQSNNWSPTGCPRYQPESFACCFGKVKLFGLSFWWCGIWWKHRSNFHEAPGNRSALHAHLVRDIL